MMWNWNTRPGTGTDPLISKANLLLWQKAHHPGLQITEVSKVASKILLIFAASETAGINQGSLSKTTQAGVACLLKCFPALFMTASAATVALLQHQLPTFLFMALSMEKILLFARWNVSTELMVFGSKFLLGLCLMLFGSSAVCPSAPSLLRLLWVLRCSFYSSCYFLLSSKAFCWAGAWLIWAYKHVFRCKDLKDISIPPNTWAFSSSFSAACVICFERAFCGALHLSFESFVTGLVSPVREQTWFRLKQ